MNIGNKLNILSPDSSSFLFFYVIKPISFTVLTSQASTELQSANCWIGDVFSAGCGSLFSDVNPPADSPHI